MSHSNDSAIQESQILSNWGIFIINETRPGPGERPDPETGEYGTKPQALANMINSGRDEEDEAQLTISGSVDDCWLMQTIVHKQCPEYKAALYGWFAQWRFSRTMCLEHVARKPLTSAYSKYERPEDFAQVLNKAIFHVEREFKKAKERIL